jgi:hypothetical protein
LPLPRGIAPESPIRRKSRLGDAASRACAMSIGSFADENATALEAGRKRYWRLLARRPQMFRGVPLLTAAVVGIRASISIAAMSTTAR